MTLQHVLKQSFINLRRHKGKTIVSILINTCTTILILCSLFFTISSFYFIDDNLNNLEGEMVFREFTLEYSGGGYNVDVEDFIKELYKIPHIEKVSIISLDQNISLQMTITVDDYRNISKVTHYFSNTENYMVIINEKAIINVELIKTIKIISFIALCIVMVATVITVIINVNVFINERRYEIALYKVVGYNKSHLFKLVFTESSIMVIVSCILAYISTLFLFNNILSRILSKMEITNLMRTSISLDLITVLITGVICMLFTFFLSIIILNKMNKISPYMLLKNNI